MATVIQPCTRPWEVGKNVCVGNKDNSPLLFSESTRFDCGGSRVRSLVAPHQERPKVADLLLFVLFDVRHKKDITGLVPKYLSMRKQMSARKRV